MREIKQGFYWFSLLSLVLSTAIQAKSNYEYRPGYLLVKHQGNFRSKQMMRLHQRVGAKVVERFEALNNLELVKLQQGVNAREAVQLYRQDPSIVYAEPDYILHALDVDEEELDETPLPNDPMLDKQWFLKNTGQDGGVAGVDINAENMWKLSTGTAEPVLAIIDTGIAYTHPDLKDNVWTNPGEVGGDNKDNDEDGYADDLHGINAITGTGDPMDDNRHGTHVAGIIAAKGNNALGVSGVMHNASLLGCKFLDASGSGNTSDAIKCIEYLIKLKTREKNPVNIVAANNSWGGGPFQQSLYEAINKLKDVGILFIAAASNDARDNDNVEVYPANYRCSNVISVAAIDSKGALASFSNYGHYTVHVMSPGVKIYSTLPGDAYGFLSGTSMATPVVTGLVGLLKSYRPELSMSQLRNLVLSSGQTLPDLAGKTITGRLVKGAGSDGTGILTCSEQKVQMRLQPKANNITVKVGATVPLSAININCSEPGGDVQVHLDKSSSMSLYDDGNTKDTVNNDGIYTGELKVSASGKHQIQFFDNDVVNITAYDPSIWRNYKYSEVPYSYVNISGKALQAGDDTIHTVVSPFPLHFAGEEAILDTLYVNSNGGISLTDDKILSWQNRSLPYGSYDTVIAPYWDDLAGGEGRGDIYYEVVGEAPRRQLVIEWRGMTIYDAGIPITFEVVFFEDSANILFNYKNITVQNARYDGGASATVGIQIRSDVAKQVGFNKAVLKSESALLFEPLAKGEADPNLPPLTDTPLLGGEPASVQPAPAVPGAMDNNVVESPVGHKEEAANLSSASGAKPLQVDQKVTAMGCVALPGAKNKTVDVSILALLISVGFLRRKPILN